MNLELTLEQQLKLQIYQREAQNLPQQKLVQLLIELLRQSMIKDNTIRNILKEHPQRPQ